MIFLSYLGGWALYRLWAWLGWTYGAMRKKIPQPVRTYWRRFWLLVVRDGIVQAVLGLAWLSGLLDKALTAAFASLGMESPAITNPLTACLTGFIAAVCLSEVIVKHLPVGDFGEPPNGNGGEPCSQPSTTKGE